MSTPHFDVEVVRMSRIYDKRVDCCASLMLDVGIIGIPSTPIAALAVAYLVPQAGFLVPIGMYEHTQTLYTTKNAPWVKIFWHLVIINPTKARISVPNR